MKKMQEFMKTASEINSVLRDNEMKLNKRNGDLFLCNKQGIRVDLNTLFKAIGEKEKQEEKSNS